MDGEWVIEGGPIGTPSRVPSSLCVRFAGKELTFNTGVMARQTSGAVTGVEGETHTFASACFEKQPPAEPIDFTPLKVDYFERSSSAGRTPGGYIKRDGRASKHETLTSRLIDRPIRPLMADGWSLETQLTSYVLAYDGVHLPDVSAVCAASAALALSEVPFPKPVAAVRVGLVPAHLVADAADAEASAAAGLAGERVLVINPTREQLTASSLDLVIAGTRADIMMVEGFCDFLPEETVLEALELGLGAVRTLASAIAEWGAKCGKPKHTEGVRPAPAGIDAEVEAIVGERLEATLSGPTKDEREDWEGLVSEAVEALCAPEREDGAHEKVDVKKAFKRLAGAVLRRMGERGVRQDGRSTTEVRPITIVMDPLPKQVHGSVLFTRGETQALATATLGDESMAQRSEGIDGESSDRFYLQYQFPPFSVGEVGRLGAPGRREVGHGNLAERALAPAMPSVVEFPYVVRAESMITESCGSSSMASVCGGSLAMMAAGVPLRSAVAGVAMGLLLDESGGGGEPIVLTDILGSEDALGTMDFKLAGDTEGITAFQLDIKCEGLSLATLKTALAQARRGRLQILSRMQEACAAPRAALPPSVPKMSRFQVEPSRVGRIIGTGGATIKGLIEDTGVENISIDKRGEVTVTGTDPAAIEDACERVRALGGADGATRPEAPPPPPIAQGDTFASAEVKNIVPFGVFVELFPGTDGFCHISALSDSYVRSVEDAGLSVGDTLDVKVTEINLAKRQYRIEPVVKLAAKPGAGGGGAGGASAGGGGGGGRGRGSGKRAARRDVREA